MSSIKSLLGNRSKFHSIREKSLICITVTRRQRKLVSDNMHLYSRIVQIVEKDRKANGHIKPLHQSSNNLNSFTFLDQKGPCTLNTVHKKNVINAIESENSWIRDKIQNAKSIYSKKALKDHNQKSSQHRHILLANSPQKGAKVDPLVRKVSKDIFMQNQVSVIFVCQTDSTIFCILFRIGGPVLFQVCRTLRATLCWTVESLTDRIAHSRLSTTLSSISTRPTTPRTLTFSHPAIETSGYGHPTS